MIIKTVVIEQPDAGKHNPDPDYLRGLLKAAGLSQRIAARKVGMTYEGFRNYLKPVEHPLHREVPYAVQYALEALAKAGEG